MELIDGVGADATLECVGAGHAMETALSIARPGSMRARRCRRRCGPTRSVRRARRARLGDVLEGRINPGRVLDHETDLDGIADAYAAMDERRAINSLVRVGTL